MAISTKPKYSNHLCKVQIFVISFFFSQDEFDIHSKKFDIDGAYIPRVMFMGWYKFKFDFFLSFTPAIPNMWQRPDDGAGLRKTCLID